MGILTGLEPSRVFYFFEEICGIPHGSRNVDAISEYLVGFAKEHGLRYIQDELKNVIIFKDASKGYEQAETVMLQGHMDMVCAKRADVKHDFQRDGLKLGIDGDEIHANGTTLGGDDGIAVAYILAILESENISHPALEAVITVNEEIGLLGAQGLDCSMLKSRYLINLDSEAEGVLTVGCAGGMTGRIHLPITRMDAEGIRCILRVEGLVGGHSGSEIHKGRANANTLMGRLLFRLARCTDFSVVRIHGGEANNAIPKCCEAEILLISEQTEEAKRCVTMLQKEIDTEYRSTDPKIRLVLEVGEKEVRKTFSYATMERLIFLLFNLPNGVMRMSPDIEGLVQTSLNLGILRTEEENVYLETSIRSSVESEKQMIADRVEYMVEFLGGECARSEGYPGWAYNPDSRLRELMVQVYETMYGKKPVVEAIHAGLECGLISSRIRDLDCVSIGPDMKNIHTPEERLRISSVKRVWEYLLKVLEQLR